jgi:branched-chain amino acid transport system substrate-binding protein
MKQAKRRVIWSLCAIASAAFGLTAGAQRITDPVPPLSTGSRFGVPEVRLYASPQAATPQPTSSPCGESPAGILQVKLGHVAPMTGVLAHLGRDNENGARLAVEELNAKCVRIKGQLARFELLAEDDAADPVMGVRAAERLVRAQVNGVVGHLNSGTTIPAARLYRDAGIVQVSPSATNPRYTRLGYGTAFRMVMDDRALGEALGQYAVEVAKAKKIVVVDDYTAYGAGIADSFIEGAKKAGGRVVHREHVQDTTTDFSKLLTQLKIAKPDLVFYGGMDVVAGPMLREMKRSGITAKMMGGDGICSADLARLAGFGVVDGNVLCAEPGGVEDELRIRMRDFQDRYAQRFGQNVQIYAPYVYDAVMAMAQAMVEAGSADPAAYVTALRNTSYVGVTGPLSFDDKGDIKRGAWTLYAYGGGKRTGVAVLR